jgi:predicted TPR repeat methyltransferase
MDNPVNNYDQYSAVYDVITGDRTARINRIQSMISQYAPQAQTVLELACGTGTILAGLDQRYQKTGLDMSEPMLQIARQKLPQAELLRGDMANFNLGRQFDVVFCTYNALDHLQSFEQWQRVFAYTAHHLKPGGIFIFDTNTAERLAEYSQVSPWELPIDKAQAAVINVKLDEEGVAIWNISIRHVMPDGNFGVNIFEFHTRTFPPQQIQGELTKYFDIKQTVTDPGRLRDGEDAGRTYYICAKKA